MRCIALLSGGKDSVAAVEVAQQHGWNVVGALRVVPAEDDSFMFHTPNLELVPAVAEAMGLPIASIAAPADPVAEVAALEAGLEEAVRRWRADAILSGALASDYQRTRIDGIGHRLGVRTIAPLWHKDPVAYLDGLVAAGYDIRFSRVAADGIPAEWAGARLDQTHIARLEALRMHPAGEGGEYETLVLDAPHYHNRIVVDEATTEATASRATWHVQRWHLEPAEGRNGQDQADPLSSRSASGASVQRSP